MQQAQSDVAVRVGDDIGVGFCSGGPGDAGGLVWTAMACEVIELHVWVESLLGYYVHPEGNDAELTLQQVNANGGRDIGAVVRVGDPGTYTLNCFVIGNQFRLIP